MSISSSALPCIWIHFRFLCVSILSNFVALMLIITTVIIMIGDMWQIERADWLLLHFASCFCLVWLSSFLFCAFLPLLLNFLIPLLSSHSSFWDPNIFSISFLVSTVLLGIAFLSTRLAVYLCIVTSFRTSLVYHHNLVVIHNYTTSLLLSITDWNIDHVQALFHCRV